MLSSCKQQIRSVSFLPRAAVSAINMLAGKPKAGVNAYAIFYGEQFPEFKKAFPNFPVPELAKRIGAKWTTLAEATKKMYIDQSNVGKEGIKQQMEHFRANLTPRQHLAHQMLRLNTRARRGEIKRKDLTEDELSFLKSLPKPPYISGRGVFMSQELRKKDDSKSVTDRVAELAPRWTKMSANDRAHYEEQSKKDLMNYLEAMKKFLSE